MIVLMALGMIKEYKGGIKMNKNQDCNSCTSACICPYFGNPGKGCDKLDKDMRNKS